MYIKPGKYVHFKGNEYEVIGTATHSETLEEVVIYRALHGEGGLWVCPTAMWNEIVELGGCHVKQFTHIDEVAQEPPTGIHKYSTPTEKVELFISLFAGRDDVTPNDGKTLKKALPDMFPPAETNGRNFVQSPAALR